MEVEVFFWDIVCAVSRGVGRNHEEGEHLRAGRIERGFCAILEVVGFYAGYGVEESGIVVACHGGE